MSTLQELKDALHAARATAPVPVQQVQQKQQESIEPVDITTATETPAPAQVQNDATAQVEPATKVAQPTNTNAAPVQTTAVTPVPQEESVPTWQDIVKELTAMDDANEERKAEIKKKQRVATAIAALGDIATHAINVWGATNGYNAPIKGAPLTEAVTKQQQLNLAENDARLEKLKKLKLNAAEARKKDLYNKIKLGEFLRKERESADKAEYNKLRELKTAAEIEYRKEMAAYRKAKTKQDEEMHLKNMEKIDAQIANLDNLMDKRGTSSSKRTYTVDGVTYDNLAEAYIALPEEYQIEIKYDLMGRPIKPTKFEIEEAIAIYNRSLKPSSAEQPAQQGKEEEPKAETKETKIDYSQYKRS